MSNPFMIAAQASTSILPSTLNPAILALRASPKPKPLAKRQSFHALQLARYDPIISATADGLLAQFKANALAELDSDFDDSYDIRRRSYTREQKLAAIGYAITKYVCQKGEMVPILHKQACRDLGIDPVQLHRQKKDIDKIRSLHKCDGSSWMLASIRRAGLAVAEVKIKRCIQLSTVLNKRIS